MNLLNDINILQKQCVFITFDRGENDIIQSSKWCMRLFNATMLAGKLYGGWEILCPSNNTINRERKEQKKNPYKKVSVKFDLTKVQKLSDKGKDAFHDLEGHFGDENNLIKFVRNKYAFHSDQINGGIDGFCVESIHLYLAEASGNTFSETYVVSIMELLKEYYSSIDVAREFYSSINALTEQVTKVSRDFQDFINAYLGFILREYFTSEEHKIVEIPDQRKRKEINLPFYVHDNE